MNFQFIFKILFFKFQPIPIYGFPCLIFVNPAFFKIKGLLLLWIIVINYCKLFLFFCRFYVHKRLAPIPIIYGFPCLIFENPAFLKIEGLMRISLMFCSHKLFIIFSIPHYDPHGLDNLFPNHVVKPEWFARKILIFRCSPYFNEI